MSNERIARLAKDWSAMAQEEVKVEHIGGAFYGFCSELGALRIAYVYRHTTDADKIKAAYSENQGTWFFRLEV